MIVASAEDMVNASAKLTTSTQRKGLEGLNRPSFRLHPLKGKLKGFWSVIVRANWRIIFRFAGGKAFDVDFVAYH